MRIARSWSARLKGLLGRSGLAPQEALVLPNCRSIHTVGMRFVIDAVFVDRAWRVVALKGALPPGRIVLPIWKAWAVIEAASGTIQRRQLALGDQLALVCEHGPSRPF